jgi:hypothetical protein
MAELVAEAPAGSALRMSDLGREPVRTCLVAGVRVHPRVVAVVIAVAMTTGCGAVEEASERRAKLAAPGPVVGPTIPVGEPGNGINGLAVGEGRVWVASGGGAGSVLRIDPQRNEVVATIPVEGDVADLAVGGGAVWAAGGVCVEPLPEDPDVCRLGPRVSRIDARTNRVVATIPIEPPAGPRPAAPSVSAVAAGEGAIWVSLSRNPWTGEVVRIDPRTNSVVARIPTGGYVGELRVGGDAVWVLSHREYTDETAVQGASLVRIDPRTDRVAATPIRDELTLLGGTEYPPVMAAGEDAAWVTSPSATHPTLAMRVDARTNGIAREQLAVEHFYPVAVTEDGVWFIGSSGRNATLSRLNPETLAEDESISLSIGPVRAALDRATDTFWLASLVTRYNERASVVGVELH